jgi:transcriptional regulator with XRE-family HTH domain
MNQRKNLYEEIGSRIENFRKEKKLTQKELADKVGLTRTSIVQIEKGEQRVPIDKLYKIAKAVNLKVYDLLPDEEFLESSFDKVSEERLDENEKEELLEVLSKIKEK